MPNVMIVEDDLMLADMVEDTLIAYGYSVCGIARTVAEAVALGRSHRPDLAVIDMRLEYGELGTEVADQLSDLPGLGILFASGNCPQVIHSATHGHACITKPYKNAELKRALEIVADMVATGNAEPPLPRGFRVLPQTAPFDKAN